MTVKFIEGDWSNYYELAEIDDAFTARYYPNGEGKLSICIWIGSVSPKIREFRTIKEWKYDKG